MVWEFMVEDVFPGDYKSIPCATIYDIQAAIARLRRAGCSDWCILGREVGTDVWDCACTMFYPIGHGSTV